MDDIDFISMQVVHGEEDLVDQVCCIAFEENYSFVFDLLEHLGQCAALHELHGNIDELIIFTETECSDDVWVLEQGE